MKAHDQRMKDMSEPINQSAVDLHHDAEWAEAWAQEADRREATIAAGKADWLDGDEVVARIRAKLA